MQTSSDEHRAGTKAIRINLKKSGGGEQKKKNLNAKQCKNEMRQHCNLLLSATLRGGPGPRGSCSFADFGGAAQKPKKREESFLAWQKQNSKSVII